MKLDSREAVDVLVLPHIPISIAENKYPVHAVLPHSFGDASPPLVFPLFFTSSNRFFSRSTPVEIFCRLCSINTD